jgi:ornithine cyclodeaminase
VLRVLSAKVVQELLDVPTCLSLVEDAMIATSKGDTVQPPRWMLSLPTAPHAVLGMMPGLLPDLDLFGTKVTAVYPENHEAGLASHQSLILLFEKQNGLPVALVDGAEVTAARTAAASAVATRALAHADADDLAILGYGVQAARHLEAIRHVRPIRKVRVWGRSPERTEAFANRQRALTGLEVTAMPSARSAVEDAHIICTVSAARTPILFSDWVSPGTHINIVGSSSIDAIEVAPELVSHARLFVDSHEAAMTLGGELNQAIELGFMGRADIAGEIGAVLCRRLEGRRSVDEITAYKSVGIPAQDLACANYLYTEAARRKLGTEIPW